MRWKRWNRWLLAAAAALCLGLSPVRAFAEPTAHPDPTWKITKPSVGAGAAIVMDWQTGQVLFEWNAFYPRNPASTTKVLTALIALERGKLSDRVRVSRRAAFTPGSSMYIKPGEEYSLHDLLHGLLMRSGNDAAVAIAEHIGGSVEGFAKLMNERARQLGAKRTHFTNPHGLTDANHRTTAYDLALITREALRNPTFAAIVAQRQTPLTYEYLNRDVILYNTNRLLGMMPEADGVKTGTTSAAGACLIASATRDDHKLIAVVLHDGNRWRDAARLLQWGFDTFRLSYLGREGEVLFTTPLRDGKMLDLPVAVGGDLPVIKPRADAEEPQVKVDLQEGLTAPIARGQQIGTISVSHGQITYATVPLKAAADVPKASMLDRFYRSLKPLVRWMSDQGLF